MSEIFKAYDIRGIYNKDLFDFDAYKIGYYFIKLLKLEKLVIGHDRRDSYEQLSKYFIKGVLDAGAKIEYIGAVSTVHFYYDVFNGCGSGVMVTASHNPKDYNGFKFINNFDSFDSTNGLFKLRDLILDDPDFLNTKKLSLANDLALDFDSFLYQNKIFLSNTLENYLDFLEEIYNNVLTAKEMNLVKDLNFSLDFSQGVSSFANLNFYQRLGFNINYLGELPNGKFSNHSPDPLTAKNYLKKKNNFSQFFTAVFDGDGDRIMFYDENNELILQDLVISKYLEFFSENNSSKFAIDITVSRVVDDIAKKFGVALSRIRVGRAFYTKYMKDNSCSFGAERSGHLFFKDFYYLDNPDIALIYMLKILALELEKDRNIIFSKIFSKYDKYFTFSTSIHVENVKTVISNFESKFKNNLVNKIDGLGFDFNDYWFIIRPSNTEPVIKIVFEAISKDLGTKKFKEICDLIKNI